MLALYAFLIGVTATALADIWAIFLNRCFKVPAPNWGLVGRWFGHFPKGNFVHDSIQKVPPVRNELWIGWGVHYVTGIFFALLLLGVTGLDWVRQPTVLPALTVGVCTVAAPFLIMQPCMGAGVAASKTPNPTTARIRSLTAHTVFGICLYLSAVCWSILLG